MTWLSSPEFLIALWSILIGSACGVACALLGCFLLLKRMSLLGDAISHGVLPGIALAVLFTGEIASVAIVAGAVFFGVLTALFAETLSARARVSEDSSLGVISTSFFALGVVLISRFLAHVDLDPSCVLLGQFEYVTNRTFPLGDLEIPDAFPNMLLSLGLTSAFFVLFWKELKITSFDPSLATSLGIPPALVHYLLIGLIAGCTVTSFEAVGSILVLAMLVVPAATAHLLTDRLAPMLGWASAVAVLSSVLGYWLSARFESNIGGMIAIAAGGQFILAVLFAPRHGLATRSIRNYRLSLRIAQEEILGLLYRAEENSEAVTRLVLKEHGIAPWTSKWAAWTLKRKRWAEVASFGHWQLTETGRTEAQSVVRSHRLWEAFLGKNFELPLDHLHAPAAVIEHFIGPAIQAELAVELEKPLVDPHGKKIPR